MQEIQIFNNSEFGEVRTLIIDSEPWFFAKDIAEKLSYAKTSNMLKLVDAEDKQCLTGSDLEPLGITYPKVSFVNESGLYACIFGSKQENAKAFKRWVTSEVLPTLRKTGTYGRTQSTQEQITLIAKGTTELYQRVEGVESEVSTVKAEIEALRDELPLFPSEADKIKNAVNKRVVFLLGGKESNAYKDRSLSRKVFANCYRNLKGNFEGIGKYTEIKRKYRHEALRIVEKYEPPFFLAQQIENVNAQQSLDLEGGARQ